MSVSTSGIVAPYSAGAVALSANQVLMNGKLVASVSSNALTVAIKTLSGDDPSSNNPVYIIFKNSDLTVGGYEIAAITAAMSLVVPSGATLSAVADLAFKVWVTVFNDGGTLRLGVINCLYIPPAVRDTVTVFTVAEEAFASSEAMSTSADVAGIHYTEAAVTSKALRVVGSLEWSSGLATPGTWDTAPDRVELMRTGGKRPGETVQSKHGIKAARGSYAFPSNIPMVLDNTSPENTEGADYFSVSISPTSKANVLRVETVLNFTCNAAETVVAALFFNSTSSAFATGWQYTGGADQPAQISISVDIHAAEDTVQIGVRIGPTTNATLTMNGTTGTDVLNETLSSHLRLTEIMA